MTTLTCERAAAVLKGLTTNQLACDPDEIEELITLGLVVEADPDDIATLQWLQPIVRELTRRNVGDPYAIQALESSYAATDQEIKGDWYRMWTNNAEIARREADQVSIRRALGVLRDRTTQAQLAKVVEASQHIAPGASWVNCRELGSEMYALTVKGQRTMRALQVRLSRFGQASFKSFLASQSKTDNKMRAFGMEIATLTKNIGYVKKNREQVVIGLAKTGVPAGHALGAYHAAMQEVGAPDVAVTCARNVQTAGNTRNAAARLRYAQTALHRAGFPNTPIVNGAAKSLLTFEPIDAGIARFVDLNRRLQQVFGRGELVIKYTSRLMSASGQPAECVDRVVKVGHLLTQQRSQFYKRSNDGPAIAVALASMVKDANAIAPLVQRFREIENALVQGGVSQPDHAETDALECIACAGTPAEVVDTVQGLMEQLAQNRQPQRGDVAVAVAFAKRFAY